MKKFLKFNWISKKFFIRLFLLTILFAQWIGLYFMIKSKKVDYAYLGMLMGQVNILLGYYTYQKIKKGQKND